MFENYEFIVTAYNSIGKGPGSKPVWLFTGEAGIFLNSALRPFQYYFSSYETGQLVGGRKRENPERGCSNVYPHSMF